MEQGNEGRDWGNVKFRARRERGMQTHSADDAQSRFVTGLVVFLVVALAYPWYSYWVQSRLLVHEVEAGFRQAGAEVDALMRQAEAELAQQQQASARAEQARREITARERIAAVRVMGASDGTAGPVAVVNFGQAGVAESTAQVCQQAERFLGRALDGKRLRLQRYRGTRPATDAGAVNC